MTILFVDPEYQRQARHALRKENRREELLGGLSALGSLLGIGLRRQGNLDQQAFSARMLPTYVEAATSGDPENVRKGIHNLGDMGAQYESPGLLSPLGRLMGIGGRSKGIPPEMAMHGVSGLQALLPREPSALDQVELQTKTYDLGRKLGTIPPNAEEAQELDLKRFNADTQRMHAENQRAEATGTQSSMSLTRRVMDQVKQALDVPAGQIALHRNTPTQIALNLGGDELDGKTLKELETRIGDMQKMARDKVRTDMDSAVRSRLKSAQSPDEVFEITETEREGLEKQGLGFLSEDLDDISDKYSQRLRDKSQDQEKWAENYRKSAETATSRQGVLGGQLLRIENALKGRKPTSDELIEMRNLVENGKMSEADFGTWTQSGMLSDEQRATLMRERSTVREQRIYQMQREWELSYASTHAGMPKDHSIGRSYAIARQMLDAANSVEDPGHGPIAAYDAYKALATKNVDPDLAKLVTDMSLDDPEAISAKSEIEAALRAYLEDRDPFVYER